MLRILRIKSGERLVALVALLVITALNALVIAHYYPELSAMNVNYHDVARDTFHISGFDAWSYSVVSEWSGWQYNIYRHPLLAIFMLIPCLINQGLMALTGVNCAIFVVGAIAISFGFYAAVFFFRLLREVVALSRADATLLTLMLFSMAYIMLTVMVPDHFNLTLCMMMVTLYTAGRLMKTGRPMKLWHTVVLFVFMAGVSLNNGIKVFLAALFTNGRRFFRPRFLLWAVIVPSAAIWAVASIEFHVWAAPLEAAAKARMEARDKQVRDSIYMAYADTATTQNPDSIRIGVNKIIKRMAIEKYRRNHANPRIGDPMSKKGFLAWTDASTDRWRSIVENLMGESIQLHRSHLLEDILKDNRPMIVYYEQDYHYWIEALVAALFAAGIWCGRRSRFFWMALSWWAADMAIHVVLGFGLNEVYIMTAQWAFIIPLAMAYLLRATHGRTGLAVRGAIAALAAYLVLYNGSLIVGYLI